MEEPHTKHRKRRRRQRGLVVLIVIIIIIVVIAAAFLTRRYRPSGSSSDFAEFYGLSSEDAVMINLDHEVLPDNGLYYDGEVYIPYDVVHDDLNARFYWDNTEQVLRYALPDGLVDVSSPETTEYTFAREERSAEYPIVHMDDGQMYLSLSFLEQYTDIRSSFYEEPYRVVISNEWGEEPVTVMGRATEVRELGGNRSNVLTRLAKGDFVTVLNEMDNWSEVCTEDGFVGYVRNNTLGGTETLTYTSTFTEPEYTHIKKEGTICMVWHQTTSQAANDLLSSELESTSGINVLSPTWFYLDDNEGGIASLASADYVDYCHSRGIEVWALISNLENPDVDVTDVLNTTSKRDALINNLMSEAVTYDLDGINVDFEALDGEAGTGFLEFIRELSLRCADSNMILSVDNYAPASYNEFYSRDEQARFADYVVLMAYDEHYAGGDEGSVASIGFVQQAITDTLAEVPADQLILGCPFYTRLWQLTSGADGYTVDSEALGMTDAEDRVNDAGASFDWLEEAGQYYATFDEGGSTYEIWLEDQNSLDLKLNLMREYDLAGCAFWKLGFEKSAVWETIVKFIQ